MPEASIEKTILEDHTLRNSEGKAGGEVFLLLGLQRRALQEGRVHIWNAWCHVSDGLLCVCPQKKLRRSQHARKETEFLRLKRTRLGLDDFESLKVIGRGAFGEVGAILARAGHQNGIDHCNETV